MAAVLPVAAAAISAIGSIRAGNAANQAAKYNATVDEQAAATARSQGTMQQEAQREKARQIIGKQLAEVSSSGTGLSGSNLDNLSESLYNQELDSLNIRYESELNARGLENRAKLTRAQGKEAKIAGYLNAASSLARPTNSYLNSGAPMPAGG